MWRLRLMRNRANRFGQAVARAAGALTAELAGGAAIDDEREDAASEVGKHRMRVAAAVVLLLRRVVHIESATRLRAKFVAWGSLGASESCSGCDAQMLPSRSAPRGSTPLKFENVRRDAAVCIPAAARTVFPFRDRLDFASRVSVDHYNSVTRPPCYKPTKSEPLW